MAGNTMFRAEDMHRSLFYVYTEWTTLAMQYQLPEDKCCNAFQEYGFLL